MNNYNKNYFTEKSYNFYPKGIDIYINEEAYKNSKEHLNLTKKISMNKNKLNTKNLFKDHVLINKDILVRDYTFTEIGDRCFNFQIISKNNNFFLSLCFNISLLIPFYCSYFLITHLDEKGIGWKSSPKIFSPKNEDFLTSVLKIGEKKLLSLGYKKFPKSVSSEIIPDLSYYDIRYGNLTFFNAFFLNDYYTRL